MTRLQPADYLRHLESESERFRTVLADCDSAARVLACPEWDAADLLWHLAEVQWFWATTVRRRPAGPEDAPAAPARPASYAGLLEVFDRCSRLLQDELGSADAAEPAWSWAAEQSVGFTFRRQAHEALVHRLDAEQTAGGTGVLDAALAADGVAELLEVMYGGEPGPGSRFEPADGLVRICLSDVGIDLWARPGWLHRTDPESGEPQDGPHLLLVEAPDSPGERVAVIEGRAADVDAWLWRRRDDAGITRAGDQQALDAFAAAVDFPLT